MLECLLRCNTTSRIVNEDLGQQIQKELEEFAVGRNDFLCSSLVKGRACPDGRRASSTYLEPFHRFDKSPRRARGLGGGIVELQALKISRDIS